uniref:WW domain-containing protein n=1 Tax=Phytophthora ramorum TaxID=164328 RepID=H3GY19_PHYRM
MSTASGPSTGGGDVNVLLKAITEQAERLRAAQRTHGEFHAKVSDDLKQLALLFVMNGEHDKALPLLHRRLVIHEKFGPDDLTAEVLQELGTVYRLHGMADIAVQHLLRSLTLREKCHGQNSLKVAETLNSLALVSQIQGELEQAEKYQLRSLQVLYDSAEPEDIESEDIPWEVYKRLKQQRGPSTAANSITLLKGNMRKSVMDVVYKSSGALSPTEESGKIDKGETSGLKEKPLGSKQRVESLKRRILAGYPDVNADVARLAADVGRIKARELREVGSTMVTLVREMNRLCIRTDLTQQQLPVLEGMLEKKSASIFRGWEKRWFKVDPKTFILSYHFSKDDYARGFTPRGGFAVSRISNILVQRHARGSHFHFDVVVDLSTRLNPQGSRAAAAMEGQSDSIVLEEEIDPNYEPTEKEVLEYATWLGMDLEAERDLFWIAREGLKASASCILFSFAPLPENWKPCKTTDTEEIYYFNFGTGQSTWDHPCDEFYRNLYEEHKKKQQTNDVQETDEKKKKVKEDVAELLGRKSGKKKKGSLAKAELLGGPSLGKANALEKKPLPGLSGRLGSLGSSGFSGGLKPVAGLGPLKSEAKELGGSGIGLDSADDFKSDDLSKPMPRGPLGTVLGKKPLRSSPSATSVAMSETKSNADMTSDFEEKRERLAQNHVEKLRETQEAHESELESLRKKLKAQMEDVQDAEEVKLKQLKRELDKKKNDLENQFDRDENAQQRNRKDQLKRLETETENALSRKKQDLDREFKSEIEKLRLKHEAQQREVQQDYDQEAVKLTEKMKAMFGVKKEAAQLATELKAEVERLHDHQKSLAQELSDIRAEKNTLLQNKEVAEKERDKAHCDAEDLRRQLSEAKCLEVSAAASQECAMCSAWTYQASSLKTECKESQGQLENIKEQLMKELNEGKALREQLDSKAEDVTQLTAEMAKCQQQLESELRRRREQEDSCAALRKAVHDLEQAKAKVETKLGELESERRNPNSELLDGSNEEKTRLEKEVGRLHDQRRSLEEEMNTIRSEKDALQQNRSAAETELIKAQRDVGELRQQLSEANRSDSSVAFSQECTKCSARADRVSSLESENAAAQSEVEKLRKELVTIKEDADARVAADHESASAVASILQREKNDALEALHDQESLSKREIAVLQEKIVALETDTSTLRATCGSLQSEKDTADRRQSDLSSSASAAQDQLKSLECQLAAAQAEVARAKVELNDLQNQHATILAANTQMKDQLTTESNDKKLLREQLDAKAAEAVQRLTTRADKHQQQILSLQQQLEDESQARKEREDACDALRKEVNALEQAKRKGDAELGQLESDKRHLESEKAILTMRLDEMSMSRKRDEKSVVSVEEALADKKMEAEQLRANLKVVESDKEHFEARLKVLNQDLEQLLAKTHRLEAEYESEHARCRTIEKERDAASQKQQSLVDELETSQRKSRTLSTEVSELQGLLSKAKANEQASSSKVEQITQKVRQIEQQKERDDFAAKMKLQQAQVKHENSLHAKERAELQLQTREKELASAKDEITRRENEIESLQARVKSLLSDKEEVQAALLSANMANAASASANRESAESVSASTDVMLVKLQLADANRNELELHLADISSQLENSTRRCAALEARCRAQSVDIESLHVEVASLRSASQKMHLSALESLALVERLEYEHKKRTLRSDFLNQLRDFQEREEQALVRHKARLRAQYERHLEDLVAELEKVRQQRVEQEEALSVQTIEQIRQERTVKRTEAKRQVREEMKQFEQELHERKARDIEIISKAIEKEEDELGARLREIRQVSREEELAKQHKLPGHEGEAETSRDRLALASPGQPLHRRSTLRGGPESLDEDVDDGFHAPAAGKRTKSSNQQERPGRRQKRSTKTYQKWKQRLQEEVELLVNARTLVANQRQGLTKQAHQLKASKNEWKRNSRSSQTNPIQREVKRMLDENLANWGEGMRKLRKQEAWIKQREQKLSKMKRTVGRLKRRHKDAYERDNNLSSRSESSSDDADQETRTVWSDYSNESELASTLEKLERLEDELASDAGSFVDAFPRDVDAVHGNEFRAVYQMPQSHALQREAAYRYPLPSSSFAPRRALHSADDTRWVRSQRTAFGLRGDRFAVTPSSASRTEQVFQQKISRWAKGREK